MAQNKISFISMASCQVSAVQHRALTGLNKNNKNSTKRKCCTKGIISRKINIRYLFRFQVKLLFPPDQTQGQHYLIQHSSETISSISCFLRKFSHIPMTFWFNLCFINISLVLPSTFAGWLCQKLSLTQLLHFCTTKKKQDTFYTHSYKTYSVFISSFRNLPDATSFGYNGSIYHESLTKAFSFQYLKKQIASRCVGKDIFT